MLDPVLGYTIDTHKHRYAMWCAASAYGRKLEGGNNELACSLIEGAQLHLIRSPDDIGDDVEAWLLDLIRKLISVASRRGVKGITFGRAQKLVNIYLKTILVIGGYHDHPKVQRLHPPLDRLLFNSLTTYLFKQRKAHPEARQLFLEVKEQNDSWTALNEAQYMAYIRVIELIMGPKPLWAIEEHWTPKAKL